VRIHKHSYRITRYASEHRGGRRLITHASFDPAFVAALRLAAVPAARGAPAPDVPMSVAAAVPVQAIVRVKLAPSLRSQAFEQSLRAIPSVLRAALVTGEVDYEVQLDCPSLADLGDVLSRIRGCEGVHVASTALVLHEVAGLSLNRQAIPDEVTMQRLDTM
jgi:DNA-binding Lrp family transcriptional regulator